MLDKPQYLYWDADVILHYLSKYPKHHQVLSDIIDEVEKSNGKTKIITSALSQVEVFYLKNGSSLNISPASIAEIDKFFLNNPIMEVVGINDFVIRDTRDLQFQLRNKGKSLTFPDAIHLATAKWLQPSIFHTYNKKDFSKASSFVTFPIEEPSLSQKNLFILPPRSP